MVLRLIRGAISGCLLLASGVLCSAANAGSLTGSVTNADSTVNLSALGTSDWVHWAFDQASDVNRKATGGAVIGDYSLQGSASVVRRTTTSAYSWTDGVPVVEALTGRRKGLRNAHAGSGFSLQIPATDSASTLHLFVGAKLMTGTITATLSDGSAPPLELAVSAASGRLSLEAVIVFTADAAGETLDISWELDAKTGSGGFQLLEAAALAGAPLPGNQAPVLASIGDLMLTEGEALALGLQATDAEDPLNLVFSATSNLPGTPDLLTDNGDGTGSLDWLSAPGDAAGSPYEITVTVMDPNGAEDSETITVTVQAAATGGLLSAGSATSPALVDLSALGATDWVRWATNASTPVVSMAGGTGEIGTYAPLGNSNVVAFSASKTRHEWSDGAPITARTDSKTGFRVHQPGEGFVFSVPADETLRELTLFVGGRNAIATLQGTLSDGSAPPLSTFVQSGAKTSQSITVTYSAGSPGQTLDLNFTFDAKPSGGGGWVSIEAAALFIPGEFALPYTEDFSAGAADWHVTDEALGGVSDWQVQNGRYEQLNFMGFTAAAMQGAAQVGTVSYLDGATNLSDYRFSVTVQPMEGASQGFSQDIGAFVRHNPATGDQLRFSLSGTNGFGRLERRAGSVVTTLAQNSIGFVDTSAKNFEIRVQGPVVAVTLDGEKYFAGYDTTLTQGTVGLYCRNACGFDNVAIDPVAAAAAVFIASPADDTVVSSTTFPVSAVVLNAEPGASVEFDVPGESNPCSVASETSAGLFEAVCTVSGPGTYAVEAVYFDAEAVQQDTDTQLNVGVGDYYVAVGDSITAGLDDSTASDAVATNGFYAGTQGFEALLADRLSNSVTPVVVTNNGVPGDTSTHVLNDRIAGVLQRHPNASHLLLTVGVNEAGGGAFLPSGLGCSGAACDGTFKGNIQGIVDASLAANLVPFVSRTPPRFGDPYQTPYTSPASHSRNVLIRDEYNEVITHELVGANLGPNFFETFLGPENRFYLYGTNLHPNALGYHIMAAEFEAAITGNPQTVFYATDFCVRLTTAANCQKPLLYKQNLFETGDKIYFDNFRRLTSSIPAELDNGRWISTSHGDRNRSNHNYLSFQVPTTSTLYVAYDASATSIPAWLANDFTPTTHSLSTDGGTGSVLTLYRQDSVLGNVTLGAPDANAHGAAVNYVVILVEN